MSFADDLRTARRSAATAYHEFLIAYNPHGRIIHCFFEGQDDPSFYMNYLSGNVPSGWKILIYRCNNKKAVYDTYLKVSMQNIRPGECLFFVDKDHSDYVNEILPRSQQIFVTEFYSTENYIVSARMIERVWVELFHQSSTTGEFSLVTKKFNEQLSRFYRSVLVIMAWAIYMKRIGSPPTLNSLDLTKLFQFGPDLVMNKKRDTFRLLQYLDSVCQVTTPPSSAKHVRSIAKMLLAREPKTYIRGKFEIWFFVQFLRALEDHCREMAGHLCTAFNVRTNISTKNAIEVLGPRLEIPNSLRDFLENNIASLRALEQQLTLPSVVEAST